jgi:hypothetical protein
MHSYLVKLGTAKLTTAICQAVSSSDCQYNSGCSGDGDACSGALSPACQLQLAAAGYLTQAVQCTAAVEQLGGHEAAVQLLTNLLVSCTSCG